MPSLPMDLNPADTVWTLPPGVYFIRMHPAPALKTGEAFTFHTKFLPHAGHDCSTAEAIPASGSIKSALLYPQDREIFRIKVPRPVRLHAWTTDTLATEAEPVIGLHFSDCSDGADQMFPDEFGGMVSSLLEFGTYYISVEPAKADLIGPFKLHVEFVNDVNR